ncbi:MAG: dTDP-4-dehydrorhamnose reductase [Hyphomicrobium sp.]|jgi:dTDP-4-dehydrorhamnose reductase
MTVLVVGEQGQLAQSLIRAARRKSLPLTAIGRPRLDLLDRASIDRAIDDVRPSIVINAAAYTAVDKAESEPDAAFAINAEAVGHLGAACARRGIGIFHISTDYVFDGSKGEAYLESDPASPLGVYGRSKFAGEEQLRKATDRHAIVRTAWLYSPYGSNFLKTMLRLGAERQELSIVSDQYGNPTYAPHFADALLELARRAQGDRFEAWGTYHLAGSGEASWYEFAASRRFRSPQMPRVS